MKKRKKMGYKQWIQVSLIISGMMVLSSCGKSEEDRKATFSELDINFYCSGLTNDGKDLICGTPRGDIVAIDPYTGKTKSIYKLNRELNALAYLGDDKYLFKENSYNNIGLVYKFDIHEELKDTLTRITRVNGGGLVYDKERKIAFIGDHANIKVVDLNGDRLLSERIGREPSAMGQTDKYIYVSDYDTGIHQFSKKSILNETISLDKEVNLDFNDGYFSGTAWGISGMTILHGEIFIYYRGDGKIHKLDINLADYGDSGPHF